MLQAFIHALSYPPELNSQAQDTTHMWRNRVCVELEALPLLACGHSVGSAMWATWRNKMNSSLTLL